MIVAATLESYKLVKYEPSGLQQMSILQSELTIKMCQYFRADILL
jgi:hypothetical protein